MTFPMHEPDPAEIAEQVEAFARNSARLREIEERGQSPEPDGGEGLMVTVAPCFLCGQPFLFDPVTVISIAVDPVTGLSPELGGDPARAVKRPLHPACVEAASAERVRRGLPPHRIGGSAT